MGQGPTDARVPKTWSLVGPSLVGMAVETVGLALGLVGPGGPDKRPFDLYSLGGKRIMVCLGIIQAFAIPRSHYDVNINLGAMSLGFAPGYELSELDEIEAAVTPLAESLVSKIEDMVLPRRGS